MSGLASTTIMHEITQLRDVTGKMDSLIKSLANVKDTIDRIQDKAIPYWEGKASQQYIKNSSTLTQKIADYTEDVRASKSALEEAAASYEKTEGIQVRTVGQLDTKGIF